MSSEITLLAVGVIAGAIASCLIAIWFDRPARMTAAYDEDVVLQVLSDETAPAIDISHNGVPIGQLVRIKIGLWNSGRVRFQQVDISQSEPIRILLENRRLIAVSGPTGNRPSVNPAYDPHTGIVSFALLNPGDSIAFVIYADALKSSMNTPKTASATSAGHVCGVIAGLTGDIVNVRLGEFKDAGYIAIAGSLAIFVIGTFIILKGIAPFLPVSSVLGPMFADISVDEWAGIGKAAARIILGIGITSLAAVMFGKNWRLLRSRMPKFIKEELMK